MPNKLGPHSLATTDAGRLWASRANIVKQAFGIDLLRSSQAGAIRICRPIWRLRVDSGAEAARDVLRQYDAWGWRPEITELWNEGDEVGQRLGQGLERRVDLTAEATQVLHANGLRVAGFSFSTGVPEPADWQYVQSRGFAGVDYVAVHEYWGLQGFSTWNALRYRRVHEWLSGSHPPFVITECGWDAVEGGTSGWKLAGISGQQYANQLLAYDAELSRDPYVLGATVFTTGGGDGWGNFDVDDLVPLIIGGAPPPPPPGGGPGLALVLGLLAISAAGLILLARLTEEGGEIRVTDLRELEPGEPIPPGYTVIG